MGSIISLAGCTTKRTLARRLANGSPDASFLLQMAWCALKRRSLAEEISYRKHYLRRGILFELVGAWRAQHGGEIACLRASLVWYLFQKSNVRFPVFVKTA